MLLNLRSWIFYRKMIFNVLTNVIDKKSMIVSCWNWMVFDINSLCTYPDVIVAFKTASPDTTQNRINHYFVEWKKLLFQPFFFRKSDENKILRRHFIVFFGIRYQSLFCYISTEKCPPTTSEWLIAQSIDITTLVNFQCFKRQSSLSFLKVLQLELEVEACDKSNE